MITLKKSFQIIFFDIFKLFKFRCTNHTENEKSFFIMAFPLIIHFKLRIATNIIVCIGEF